ncbi:peptidase inhibitor family I36 protein [Jiangella gansuensis]|uniref:peptidase inhibitor family I36 protein n=1 Tax=Jiangella gansuensis TaxID=281473 RepID=UPI0004BC3157|nr:peptidase inhibitor family I36 protein [Jiangella gansuensis]
MARRWTVTSLATAVAGAVVAVTAVSAGASAARAEVPGGAHDPAAPTGPLAAELAEALEQWPGGVQVSDNAITWGGGEVVAVWPDPGDAAAPLGLGAGVREDVVAQLGLADLTGPALADGPSDLAVRGSSTSCPVGYYCFYTSSSYNGARYQFSSTCSGYASSYGFDNATSSWSNRSSSRKVAAYDSRGGTRLWTMNPGASSSYVGSGYDNRMSYWTCT